MKSRIFISGSRRPRYSTDGVFKPLICIRPHLNSLGWLHLVTHSVCQFVHTECPQSFIERSQEGCQQGKGRPYRGQEEEEEEEGILLHLHLQGPQAGPPWHWCIQQGHVHHELLREWHLWTHCCWSFPSCPLQQAINYHQQRDPDCCPSPPARWVGQARRIWGNQGRDQVHQLQVNTEFTLQPYIRSFQDHHILQKRNISWKSYCCCLVQ